MGWGARLRATLAAMLTMMLAAMRRRYLQMFGAVALCATILVVSGCSLPDVQGGSFGQTTTSGKAATVRVQILHGGGGSVLILVPVTINGHGPYKFALDTGASISIMSDKIATSLGLPTAGQGQSVAGVGGTEVAVPISVSHWAVGKVTLPSAIITRGKLPASSKDNGLQGLLGSDVLSKFGQITIDYSSTSVTFYNASTA